MILIRFTHSFIRSVAIQLHRVPVVSPPDPTGIILGGSQYGIASIAVCAAEDLRLVATEHLRALSRLRYPEPCGVVCRGSKQHAAAGTEAHLVHLIHVASHK